MLLELHQEALASSEILFTYCGDLDLPIVQGKLMEHLDSLAPRKVSKTKSKPYSPIHDVQESIPFDREQTQMFIGKSSYSILGADDLHLKILTTHLNGQSSELFVDVRDRRGLCYVVQPVHHSALEGGYWGIYIGTGKEKATQAKEAILNILRKIQRKGLSNNELKRIKRMIAGQNEMSLQTNEDYANFYSVPVLHRLGLDFQNEVYERLDQVKSKDFNAFVKEFLEEDWVIIEAG